MAVTTDVTKTLIMPGAGGGPRIAGSGTYANMPAAASFTGQLYYATDVGVPGMYIYSDGTNTYPAWPQLLARGSTDLSVTGTTSETTLATVTVPAGLLGINGEIAVWAAWSMTSSANNKTSRIRFGGIGGTVFFAGGATAIASQVNIMRWRNRGVANSQISSANSSSPSGFSTNAGALGTAAIDTTAAQTIVLTGQLTNTGETITLSMYDIWVMP